MRDQPVTTAPDPTPWLLEGDPSVRYFTLKGLLAAAPDAPEVQEARRAIMSEGAVPRILAAQGDDGHWGDRDRFYAKYTGTAWQLIILAELGADGADERVRRACEAILRGPQQLGERGTAHRGVALEEPGDGVGRRCHRLVAHGVSMLSQSRRRAAAADVWGQPGWTFFVHH